jgi:uncharacterized protein (TIGR03790 family)
MKSFAQPIDDPSFPPSSSIPQEQYSTNVNIAQPENVLVVYKLGDAISDSVKNYYVAARQIPNLNIVGISIPDSQWYNNGWDLVRLDKEGEVIRREWICVECFYPGLCPDNYAWQFYKEHIATPIASYLNNTTDPNTGEYLRDQIRYIVLCKGIPLKILSANECENWGVLVNVSVDALLCLLKTDSNNNPDILTKYKQSRITNPYGFLNSSGFLDPDYNFNHRFNSNHYVNGSWNVSYLVSRIDGQSLDEIELMIDRHLQADKSGEGLWILDGDPAHALHRSDVTTTKNTLQNYGFNFEYDIEDFCITSSEDPVIGYTSEGLHTGDNNPQGPKLDSGYVNNQLQFEYLNGAIFSSYESFNYYSNYAIYGRDDHGLVAEFVTRRPQDNQAGTGGNGHTFEPFETGTVKNRYYFPSYAMGYNMVDAAYLGMPYIGFVNIVAGDPLTTIAWGKQILNDNTIWQGTNLVTDTIFVPTGRTLSISANSVINLRHHGFITGEVTNFVINDIVTFNVTDWSRALFIAHNNSNPKLVWGNHPTIPPTYGFKVYRKINNGNWILRAQVNGNKYIDTGVEITPPGGGIGQDVYYRITAMINLIQESVPANEVNIMASRIKKKEVAYNNSEPTSTFLLSQNYPNPFNPITTITYSIKETDLVQLKVYDILGKEVAELVNENQLAGNHQITFNASYLPSGIYFYKLTSGNFAATKKLILLK